MKFAIDISHKYTNKLYMNIVCKSAITDVVVMWTLEVVSNKFNMYRICT
jgi:hypothetical protein